MSRGIVIKFNVDCPHCGKLHNVSIVTIGEIDGDTFQECLKCNNKFVIAWTIELEADVYKCDKLSSDVNLDYFLSEAGWDDDDDDDPEPE